MFVEHHGRIYLCVQPEMTVFIPQNTISSLNWTFFRSIHYKKIV